LRDDDAQTVAAKADNRVAQLALGSRGPDRSANGTYSDGATSSENKTTSVHIYHCQFLSLRLERQL
jgi:hypothetical protein